MVQRLTARPRFLLNAAYGIVLALLIGYAYGPSVNHLPRADDWWYYLNTLETHTFHDTFLASHSYARTRTVMPGNEFIYRPLFFALLAFKKDGIGPHFAWHQAIPLVLHFSFCFMSMLVLTELRRIARSDPESPAHARTRTDALTAVLVYVVPAFIAVNAALVDAVIWTHITGYLLFYVLILTIVYLFLRGCNPLHVFPRSLGVAVAVLLLASAFVYEYGQFYALVFLPWVLFLNQPLRDRLVLAAVLLCIPIAYQAANALDKHFNAPVVDNPRDMNLYAESLAQTISPETINSIARFVRYAGGVPMFPSTASIAEKEERLLVHELSVRRALNESTTAPLALVVLPLGTLLAVFGYATALRHREFRLAAAALTLTAFFGLYALGISLVRVNPDADLQLVLAGSSYYMYWPFTLLLIILTGGLLLFAHRAHTVVPKLITAAATLALITYLTIEGAASTAHLHHVNASLADQQARSRAIVAAVNDFFEEHPDAGVAFDLEHSIHVPDTWDLGVPLTTLLYRAHENNFNPDYLVRITRNGVEAIPRNADAADPMRPLVPHLVQAARHVNVYLYDGEYHGLLRFEGRYTPDRHREFRYLASGSTVEDVLAQQPGLVDQREHDVASGILRDRYWH